jgi:hypothetical protein
MDAIVRASYRYTMMAVAEWRSRQVTLDIQGDTTATIQGDTTATIQGDTTATLQGDRGAR